MTMIKSMLLIGVASLLTNQACNSQNNSGKSQDEIITTPSGLQYVMTKKGDGIKPKKGDKVVVHYTGKLTDGSVFDSSVERGKPFSFKLGAGQVIKGWDEGIALLQVGGKATFTIPPELGYGKRGSPPVIPADATLIFDVELMDVVEKVAPKPKVVPIPFDVEGKETVTTKSGLQYIMVKEGMGVQPESGKQVFVHYTGYLDDGSIFDSSIERGQPLPFKLGAGQVIKGWDEGVALLKVGGKARLIIPSGLAYGERGHPGLIPPNATLTFDVELVDVK